MWMILAVVLASGPNEPLSVPPLVEAAPATEPARSNPATTELSVEQTHVPRLSQSAGTRTMRFLIEASGAGMGALVGGVGFAAVGFVAGGLAGGCGLFTGGDGCWIGLLAGAATGHLAGLVVGTHLTGHVLGTNTPFWMSVVGGLAGEAATLAALLMTGYLAGSNPVAGNSLQLAVLLTAPAVSALIHELADTSGNPKRLAIAPVPLRDGGGLAALISF